MTSTMPITLTCHCCSATFDSETWASTNSLGPLTTDFDPRPSGLPSLPLEITTCPQCGFSGSPAEFVRPPLVPDDVKDKVKKEIGPQRDYPIPAWKSYEYAARIAEWRGAAAHTVGRLYHKAAWCSRDEELLDKESAFRREAARQYQVAFDEEQIPEAHLATYAYIVGELLRRVGEHDEAKTWFSKAEVCLSKSRHAVPLAALITQQSTQPKEFIEGEFPQELVQEIRVLGGFRSPSEKHSGCVTCGCLIVALILLVFIVWLILSWIF